MQDVLKDTGLGVGEGHRSCAVPLWETHAALMQNGGLEYCCLRLGGSG